MSELHSAEPPPSGCEVSARRPYVRPELTEFGSVKELTRGGTGAGGEAQTARKNIPRG